jgi:hypothetical protein
VSDDGRSSLEETSSKGGGQDKKTRFTKEGTKQSLPACRNSKKQETYEKAVAVAKQRARAADANFILKKQVWVEECKEETQK